MFQEKKMQVIFNPKYRAVACGDNIEVRLWQSTRAMTFYIFDKTAVNLLTKL